jgi:hypothetical protein
MICKAQLVMRKPKPQAWVCLVCNAGDDERKAEFVWKLKSCSQVIQRTEPTEAACALCRPWIHNYLGWAIPEAARLDEEKTRAQHQPMVHAIHAAMTQADAAPQAAMNAQAATAAAWEQARATKGGGKGKGKAEGDGAVGQRWQDAGLPGQQQLALQGPVAAEPAAAEPATAEPATAESRIADPPGLLAKIEDMQLLEAKFKSMQEENMKEMALLRETQNDIKRRQARDYRGKTWGSLDFWKAMNDDKNQQLGASETGASGSGAPASGAPASGAPALDPLARGALTVHQLDDDEAGQGWAAVGHEQGSGYGLSKPGR